MERIGDKPTYRRRAVLGIALYLVLALAPVALMLLLPDAPPRELLREFAVALGFCAIGILGTQFAVSPRLSRLKAPYGIDTVYYFHCKMTVVAVGLVVAHPALLIAVTPERIALLNVFTAPPAARYGVGAVVSVGVIVAISLWRTRLRLPYEAWRGAHNVLAFSILLLASLHVVNTGLYTEGWRMTAFLVYPALWLGILGYARVVKPLKKRRRPYLVDAVRQEAPDVWTLALSPEGHGGIRFRPGQFAWVTIGDSPFSLHEHPFSFSSSPPASRTGSGFDITVKELGDFTSTIGRTRPGTIAYVDGPFGAFTTDRYPASSYVFIAGGIGITPVMSILRTAEKTADPTPLALVYGAATRDDLVFADELDRLSERLDLRITYVLEEPPDGWSGPRGFITREVLEAALPDAGMHEYFVCGPPAMTEAVETSLAHMDVSPRRIHFERFAFD